MFCYLHGCPDDVKMIGCYPTLHRQEVEDNLALLDNLKSHSRLVHGRQTHIVQMPNGHIQLKRVLALL